MVFPGSRSGRLSTIRWQRQRLAIARALLQAASDSDLDELPSCLMRLETLILRMCGALFRAARSSSSRHRLSTLSSSLELVLSDGQLVEDVSYEGFNSSEVRLTDIKVAPPTLPGLKLTEQRPCGVADAESRSAFTSRTETRTPPQFLTSIDSFVLMASSVRQASFANKRPLSRFSQ